LLFLQTETELLLYNIAITLVPGIGDITGKKLIKHFGDTEKVFNASKKELKEIPGIRSKTIDAILNKKMLDRAKKEISFIEKNNIQPLFFLDNEYPERLKHCIDGPLMLYYKGSANLNAEKSIGIVGTRNASQYGKSKCKEIVKDLSALEILLVSGLAYGIDTIAHQTAVENGLPTVCVLAHGLDRIYPSQNKQLAKKILENGGWLTEFMSDTNPDRENFPKRNRIIAGMVDTITVIESAKRGGALITANIAQSYNRDIFALPGRVDDEYSEGCNFLIKTNRAALIQNGNDIKYYMNWEKQEKPKSSQRKLFIELAEDDQKIFDFMNEQKELSFDALSHLSGLPPSKIAASLLNLEMEGLVDSLPGKIYKLA